MFTEEFVAQPDYYVRPQTKVLLILIVISYKLGYKHTLLSLHYFLFPWLQNRECSGSVGATASESFIGREQFNSSGYIKLL